MSKYSVSIPIAGSIEIEVEAGDEEAAKDAAWEAYGNVLGSHEDAGMQVSWEAYEELVTGNCAHFGQNEVEVTSNE